MCSLTLNVYNIRLLVTRRVRRNTRSTSSTGEKLVLLSSDLILNVQHIKLFNKLGNKLFSRLPACRSVIIN